MVFYIDYKSLSLFVLLYVNIAIYSGYPDTQNKKDRHHACPEVNCIVHSTSILSERTETAVWDSAVSSLFKIGRFRTVLVRTEFAQIQGSNSLCEIYMGEDREIMRALFRTKIFYHFASIFAIVSSPFRSYIYKKVTSYYQ